MILIPECIGNVISPTPNGNQWWDRNCQQHVPSPCRSSASASRLPPAPTPHPPSIVPTISSPIILTTDGPSLPTVPTSPLSPEVSSPAAPSITPRAVLAKRDAPFPPYLSDLSYAWSSVYMIPACSCIVSSAGQPVLSTTTKTATEWTSSTVSFIWRERGV